MESRQKGRMSKPKFAWNWFRFHAGGQTSYTYMDLVKDLSLNLGVHCVPKDGYKVTSLKNTLRYVYTCAQGKTVCTCIYQKIEKESKGGNLQSHKRVRWYNFLSSVTGQGVQSCAFRGGKEEPKLYYNVSTPYISLFGV